MSGIHPEQTYERLPQHMAERLNVFIRAAARRPGTIALGAEQTIGATRGRPPSPRAVIGRARWYDAGSAHKPLTRAKPP